MNKAFEVKNGVITKCLDRCYREVMTINNKGIGDSVFSDSYLKYLTVKPSCKFIGNKAFANSCLETIKIESDNTYISNSILDGCNYINLIQYGDKVYDVKMISEFLVLKPHFSQCPIKWTDSGYALYNVKLLEIKDGRLELGENIVIGKRPVRDADYIIYENNMFKLKRLFRRQKSCY